MSFFEIELPRKIDFDLIGGAAFNSDVIAVQSGQEQRNRNWLFARAEYEATGLITSDSFESRLAFIDDVRTFFYMVGGMADGFRFFDELDSSAVGEAMVVVPATSNLQWQLQKTYSLGGRTYVRAITKPINTSVKDYQGNALANTITIHVSGTTVASIDHTTGIVTFVGAPTGTPTADFGYHIPVRFTSDKFQPQTKKSGPGARLIKWNSLGLIEVRPPNY